MNAQKSVVLVTVDCLRADHVGFMGYDRPTTPFLDSLASQSFVFPSAIVAGAPTYYSFPAIMASRYPLAMGRDLLGLAPDEPSLASVLKQSGYATASFSAANPYISARFGYAQGFDVFRDFLEGEPVALSESNPTPSVNGWASRLNHALQKIRPHLGAAGIPYDEAYFEYCQRLASPPAISLDALRRFPAADVLVEQASAWLGSVGEGPFFLWLHLMDPHAPYYPTEKALTLMGSPGVSPFQARYLNSYWNRFDVGPKRLARHRDEVVDLYDAGIRWVDEQMATLVDALRRSQRWDDCIFAVTADHGEEFLDHGGRFHPPSELNDDLLHVPLLLRVPGTPKQELPKSPFSMMHLAPTLLDAAQIPIPASFRGSSWWNEMQSGKSLDLPAISESVSECTNPFHPENRLGPRVLAVRDHRFKLVLHFDPKEERLYDLEADPKEQAPLPPSAGKKARARLLEIAQQHIRQSIGERDTNARLSARLRELRLEWPRSSPQAVGM